MRAEKYIGIIELERRDGDHDIWEIVRLGDRLYYGTSCNVGFLRHGYIEIGSYYTEQDALEELATELELMARDGSSQHCSGVLVEVRVYA
jgi:hypothetical protein